jgi:hypothetical protein
MIIIKLEFCGDESEEKWRGGSGRERPLGICRAIRTFE